MGLRILLASDFYPPFIGGAERQVYLLGQELANLGHNAQVVTVWHTNLPENEQDGQVAIHRLRGLTTRVPWFSKDPGRRYHPPFPEPGITWGIRRLIKQWQPDIVHASGWIAYSCAAALVGMSIPLVLSARDYGYSCAVRTLLQNGQHLCNGPGIIKCLQCAQITYGRPKAIAAVSGVLGGRQLLRQKVQAVHSVSSFVQAITERDLYGVRPGQPGSPVTTIADVVPPLNQALDSAAIARVRDCLPTTSYLLFVGALQPHKGVNLLLEAYTRLAAPPPLVLIGTVWPDTPRIVLPGVHVLENVPHATVMQAWRDCLFGIIPSIWPDPLPGVVREAMSVGKAVIATATGGNLDMIIDNETGLLVPPGDAAALAAAIQRLIGDPVLRERLGSAAQRTTTQFTGAFVAHQFDALYQRVHDRSSSTTIRM